MREDVVLDMLIQARAKRRPQLGAAGYCACCGEDVPEGPDACLGIVPGVSQACCGHGDWESAYVTIKRPWPEFWVTLRGEVALKWMAREETHGEKALQEHV